MRRGQRVEHRQVEPTFSQLLHLLIIVTISDGKVFVFILRARTDVMVWRGRRGGKGGAVARARRRRQHTFASDLRPARNRSLSTFCHVFLFGYGIPIIWSCSLRYLNRILQPPGSLNLSTMYLNTKPDTSRESLKLVAKQVRVEQQPQSNRFEAHVGDTLYCNTE